MPLNADDSLATGKVEEGRRRLTGAFYIDISRIRPDPNQPRKKIDATYLRELTASVKTLGLLQPITVRYVESHNHYRIITGECRYTAAKIACLPEIPCWVKTPKADEILLEQIVENWQRSDLNPFELADSLAILRDANGYSQQELAKHTGKSEGEISKILSIHSIDPKAQKVARSDTSGRVTKRHLYAITRLDPPSQLRLIERIQSYELSAIDIERFVARRLKSKQSADNRGPRYARRQFTTLVGRVIFHLRKPEITDDDVLAAITEIEQQLSRHDNEPS